MATFNAEAMKTNRIGILQVIQESNHLNPIHTEVKDYESFRLGFGDEGLTSFASGEEVGGFVEGLGRWPQPVKLVGLLLAQAWSGGPLSAHAYQWFVDRLTEQLSQTDPLDGILFSLHGALVAEDEIDTDGALLEHLRQIVGPQLPVVATLDCHAYLTPRMIRHASVLVTYHTNPHLDRWNTGVRAAGVLQTLLNGAQPTVGVTQLPMNTTGEMTVTSSPILSPIFDRLNELESRDEVLSASVHMTQPWLDVADLGWSTMVVADDQSDLAQKFCEELADMCWSKRDALKSQSEFYSADDCVTRALACPGKPVVVADGADATNSGAPGDSVHLLRAMLNQSIPDRALTMMVDESAVHHAQSVGEDGYFSFAVGGKRDHVFSQPLSVAGRVRKLCSAKYVLSGHLGDRLPINMGNAAVVEIGDVTLLLTERTGPGSTPLLYRCVGLEPKDFKIVVVKSPAGFRAEYEPFAADVLLSDCPGCATPRLDRVPYSRISRPLWPLDEIKDWRDVEWCMSKEWPPAGIRS